jgi:hypothetical protein
VGTTKEEVDPNITTLDGALEWLIANVDTDSHVKYAIQLDGTEVVKAWKTLQCTNKAVEVRICRYQAETSGAAVITFTTPDDIPAKKPDGILVVDQGINLILDQKITVSGGGNCPILKEYGGFILVLPKGKLTMEANSKITEVAVRHSSGAVTVNLTDSSEPSYFVMNGGEISGNTVSGDTVSNIGDSPAVLLGRYGKFTMNGGLITNNTRGVVVSGLGACFTMEGGSITNNGTVDPAPPLPPNPSDPVIPRGLRGGGVCVGVNLTGGTFKMKGGTISGNGVNPAAGALPTPGGEVYVAASNASLILNGVVNINSDNTVCLTNANPGNFPMITLEDGFKDTNPLIKLDLAATRPEWVPNWVGPKVLQLDGGTTPIPLALRERFVLGNFYYSSGNKDFEPSEVEPLLSEYEIDDQGKLVLKPQPNPGA